ncbi:MULTISPECIES: alpha-L-arabinofuranosidase C-terminal domain-containing protein [unclassified Solwaraspora]|uniref:alpha-L-arabinofuranosidase C-terminal domain-containing protein n=1 Tax=unclassified Solwaraspora TaxID=2627926 RepID=UPI00259BE0A9|nr:alpha-L-arabinofuranosidase C-terminal domain-containing protein [Solwaraspora sp. WMMA2056]WJK39276.1 alpha-L-arabinofuranosidase C-terminal domain-containing protein [Solwaraspora sp. WMMA2056]
MYLPTARPGLTGSALLVGALVATAAVATGPSLADPPRPEPEYTITVDPAAAGVPISDTMYGVFFEDINYAADGGLYAELVRNRSFEFLPVDNQSFTGLTGWAPGTEAGGSGTATPVDDDGRLNDRNRTYLRLDLDNIAGGRYGVTNSGYNSGIAVEAGKRYDFSVWARTDSTGNQLTVRLLDVDGRRLAEPQRLRVHGDDWTRYTATFTAHRTSDVGRLAVLAGGTGTVRLDMVSLFPQETFRGRPNGLRKDLAQKIEALRPGFVRFPGGCLVNTGSMDGYDAGSGWERARSYQWKDTVGPVETRATNANFWGYNQSYGLGYYEYFQFAEDIGAMPLPVVPALVTGCGQNQPTVDEPLLQRHISDTLDLIEFATGPADSTWGGLRADMGHPEPFNLTHVAVGNEENLPEAFFANFQRFRAAIEARYPQITVISNSGPDDQGATFDRLWQLNRAAGVEMVDEHYYNSPAWFLQNNDRYDSYDRAGPKVFLGEYASQDNKLYNSLAEAAFMTGLERNADIVEMASYAPLLANIDHVRWRPDLIWFDNDESWGTTSYQVQKLFMTNVGDRTVPSGATGPALGTQPITGRIGLSTWATSATYDDVKVTAPDGTVLFSDDFATGADQWTPVANRGSWSVVDEAYTQSDTAAQDTMVAAAEITAADYDLSLTATKNAGAEGFLIGFGVKDAGNFYWWNLGGWNNTQGAVEKATNGAKETLIAKPNQITTGTTYDITVKVRGDKVTLLLDGEVWGEFVDDRVTRPFAQVVTRDEATGDLLVKVVNAQDKAAVTMIDLGDLPVRSTAQMTVISGDPAEQNTRSAEPIQPVTTPLTGVASRFTHTFEPYSVTFIRIRTK